MAPGPSLCCAACQANAGIERREKLAFLFLQDEKHRCFCFVWSFLEDKEEYNEKRRKIYRHSSQISNKLFGKVIIIIYRSDKLLTLAFKATTMSVETGESERDAPNGQSRR